jgi:hypothetical protein
MFGISREVDVNSVQMVANTYSNVMRVPREWADHEGVSRLTDSCTYGEYLLNRGRPTQLGGPGSSDSWERYAQGGRNSQSAVRERTISAGRKTLSDDLRCKITLLVHFLTDVSKIVNDILHKHPVLKNYDLTRLTDHELGRPGAPIQNIFSGVKSTFSLLKSVS